MLPQYTLALGKTEAVEKIMNFMNTQESVKKTILNKLEDKGFDIGGDNTFIKEQEALKKGSE